MSTKLPAEHEALIASTSAAMKLPPSGPARLLWRKLRALVLPEAPPWKRGEDPLDYALRQAAWQRLAALAVESHVAATQLLKMEIEYRNLIAARDQGRAPKMTPDQIAGELRARVRLLPQALQEELLTELAAALGVRIEGVPGER